MRLPFTVEEFLGVFQHYNPAIWPVQIVAYLAGAFVLFLTIKEPRYKDRMIGVVLSLMWLWNGGVYHIGFFSEINKAAFLFGTLFIVEGLLFFWWGVIKNRLVFGFSNDGYSVVGGIFILYALGLYPVLGILAGHTWPHSPIFGVAPCPTTIFTFGMLLATRDQVKKHLLAIPLGWAVVGMSAALNLRIYEDFGLSVAGLVGTTLLLIRDRKGRQLPYREGAY